MSGFLPSIQSVSVVRPVIIRKETPWTPGPPAKIDSAEVSAVAPASRLVPGTVLVYRTSTEKFVMAGHASGDRNTPAIVVALETADTDWDGETYTFEVTGKDGIGSITIPVVLAGTDDTDTEVAAAFNASKAFQQAGLYAYVESSRVKVRTHAGEGNYLKITSTLATAYGASGTASSGASAKYLVLNDFVDLKDAGNVAVDNVGPTLQAASFKTSALVWHASITDAVKAEAMSNLVELGANFG